MKETNRSNIYPNFFIVGSMRSGTTSLWHSLKNHPEVFMPQDELFKEPGYFSDMFNPNRMSLNDYLNIFREAVGKKRMIGEASTVYLPDPSSAKRIFCFNPRAKIIIVLRHPVDRAYSLYNYLVQEGYEYARDFKTAIALEKNRKTKTIPNFWEPEFYWSYMYISSGFYFEQVKRYIDIFGEKVLVILFDDLVSQPEQTFDSLCRFLEVKKHIFHPTPKNRSRSVFSPLAQFFLRKINSLVLSRIGERKPFFRKIDRDLLLPFGIRSKPPVKLDPVFRKKTMALFFEDIEKLSCLINRDFSHWLK